MSDDEYKEWIREKKIEIIEGGHEFVESKWWKISRYECTFIQRDYQWWNENVEHILKFYNDLNMYKSSTEKMKELKAEIAKKKKRNVKDIPLDDFMLISDEEDN